MRLDSRFIKLICFPFDDPYCISGALPQACSEPVTEVVGRQNRFPVNDLNSTFRASRDTEPTSVTFILINLNNLPYHGITFQNK